MRERGLKPLNFIVDLAESLSLPMRERGLKQEKLLRYHTPQMSLPMRERGLKHSLVKYIILQHLIAPHAGAWIETSRWAAVQPFRSGRSPCGSVD